MKAKKAEKLWWVGRKIKCDAKLKGDLCGKISLILTKKTKPVFVTFYSGNSVYKVKCPLCNQWTTFIR